MEPRGLEEIEVGTKQLEFGVHSGESVPERESSGSSEGGWRGLSVH